MLRELSEFLPMPVIFAVVCWALVTHFITAQLIANRIAEFDHRPACEAMATADIAREADEALAAVPEPGFDPRAQIATTALGLLKGAPGSQWGAFMDYYGFTDPIDQVARASEMAEIRAREAYEQTRSRLQAAGEARIAAAPDICSCQFETAYQETARAWSIWVGTFGLIGQPQVAGYGAAINSVRARGLCAGRTVS